MARLFDQTGGKNKVETLKIISVREAKETERSRESGIGTSNGIVIGASTDGAGKDRQGLRKGPGGQ